MAKGQNCFTFYYSNGDGEYIGENLYLGDNRFQKENLYGLGFYVELSFRIKIFLCLNIIWV